jgi:hypothetical protein
VVATAPGLRFFYDGQFEGKRAKVPVQLGRWPDEPADPHIAAVLDRVLAFAADAAFTDGAWKLPHVGDAGDDTHHSIVALLWKHDDALKLVTANVSPRTAQAHVDVVADLPLHEAFDFVDELTGASYRWTMESLRHRGLYVRLEPGAVHLFTVRTWKGE